MAGLIRKEAKSIEAFLVKSLWEKFSQYGLLSQKRGLELDKCNETIAQHCKRAQMKCCRGEGVLGRLESIASHNKRR